MNGNNLKRAGVMGWPVSHSLSPRLHQYWLNKYNIEGSYDALPVATEDLEKTLRSLQSQGFAGVNLTIPHKEQSLIIVDEVDDIAQHIGAVNTVIVKNGTLFGTNTDAYGFMENLRAQTKNLSAGRALVLGAGGAARAVCAGLLDEKWHVTLAGRTRAKAEAIAEKTGAVKVIDWEKVASEMQSITLLINTTPLGMQGQTPLEISLDRLPKEAWVYDIVYNPLMTLLLTQAQARGNKVVTGLGMLLYQAQPAFEAWFGIRPDVTQALQSHMLEALT